MDYADPSVDWDYPANLDIWSPNTPITPPDLMDITKRSDSTKARLLSTGLFSTVLGMEDTKQSSSVSVPDELLFLWPRPS